MAVPVRLAGALLAVATLGAPTPAAAAEMPPPPLWKIIGESELIVVARVESFNAEFAPAEDLTVPLLVDDDALARLRVVETWKGRTSPEIDVRTHRDYGPRPPPFRVGDNVLVFLVAEGGAWEVSGLYHGLLRLDPADLALFRSRVAEAVALQAKGASDLQRADWAVRCASRRATRWHGLEELEPAVWKSTPALKTALTGAQLRVISEGFVREPSSDGTLPQLLQLLDGVADPAFDAVAVAATDALAAGDAHAADSLESTVDAIARRFGVPAPVPNGKVDETPSLEAQQRQQMESARDRWRALRPVIADDRRHR